MRGVLATKRGAAIGAAAAMMLALVGCGDDDDDTAAFCERYRTFEDEAEETTIDSASSEDLDIEEIKTTFQEQLDDLDELVDAAPEEIADDVEAQRDELEPANEAVQAAETPEDLIAALEELTDTAADDEVNERGSRIDDWIEDNCDSDGAS